MFCHQCGVTLQRNVNFCTNCGTAVNVAGSVEKTAPVQHNAASALTEQGIWNPNVAALLSLIFSPAFGAYLQAMNWRTLGRPERARSSKAWFYFSLAVALLVFFIVIALIDNLELAQSVLNVLLPSNLILWYLFSGRLQAKFVKEHYGKNYRRCGWLMPLLFGVVGVIVYFILGWLIGNLAGMIMYRL